MNQSKQSHPLDSKGQDNQPHCPDCRCSEQSSPETRTSRAALDAIIEEREYQKTRWTPDHDMQHTPEEWHIIMSVWLGKLANETPMFQGESYYDKKKFLKRLAQIGAIAAAAYESISASPE